MIGVFLLSFHISCAVTRQSPALVISKLMTRYHRCFTVAIEPVTHIMLLLFQCGCTAASRQRVDEDEDERAVEAKLKNVGGQRGERSEVERGQYECLYSETTRKETAGAALSPNTSGSVGMHHQRR